MWDERYSEAGFAYGTKPNDFLRENVEKLPAGKILCLAEGEGRNAVFLATRGFEVTAVDFSEVGLEKTEKLAKENNVSVETVCADLADFIIEPKSWDAIVSIWVPIPSIVRRVLHKKVVGGLRTGGAFLLEAYTPQQLDFGTGGGKEIDLMVSLDSLQEELKGLHFDIAQEIEREVQEGKYHNGQSAVVRVLAFK
ncbi:MAG: class I SAM-dependent methyltransferase [Acidobacteria bacterium]|nr:class I SAM-dependent methyltransferase [Acidobacteriota bacterium]